MILLINTCKEKLHFYEFVKPVGQILIDNGIKGFIRQYDCVTKKDIRKASKIIICGTSLGDFDYFNNIKYFDWIKDFNKPILGICAGMQVMVHFLGGELWGSGKNIKDRVEIGQTRVKFEKGFLGLSGSVEVYSLHQLAVIKVRNDFEVYATSDKGIQAIKHKTLPFYGVLFHPEVRNRKLIEEFCKL